MARHFETVCLSLCLSGSMVGRKFSASPQSEKWWWVMVIDRLGDPGGEEGTQQPGAGLAAPPARQGAVGVG